MGAYEQELAAKFNITERELERNGAISALFQNSVAALNVGTGFYTVDATTTDPDKLRAWGSVYRMTLHMILKGDFAGIIDMIDDGKEYPCDSTPRSTVEAWDTVAKFFKLVYTVWQIEQDRARVVPVAKFLDKVKDPEPPYYHNWISNEVDKAAYYAGLETVTSMLNTLDEATFMGVCQFVRDDKNIKNTSEARAVQYICAKYEQAHRARSYEITQSYNLAVKVVDFLGDM